jgi:hypothetical protein
LAAIVCALAMLGAAAWLTWAHKIGTLIALDPERTLTLIALLTINASVLFVAAHPTRAVSRSLGWRSALGAARSASINVGAAAFFVIDAALGASALSDATAPLWLDAFLVPAAAALVLFVATLGARPEESDEISDEDIAEAALILTESQRRWSWRAVFEMTASMATTRTIILAVYFAWLVAGLAAFDWLSKAFLKSQPLTLDELRATGVAAIAQGGALLTQGWVWFLFVFVVIVPSLLILSAAVWYRYQMRRERARLYSLSQSPVARLMTHSEIQFLQRRIERPLLAEARALAQQRNRERAVS